MATTDLITAERMLASRRRAEHMADAIQSVGGTAASAAELTRDGWALVVEQLRIVHPLVRVAADYHPRDVTKRMCINELRFREAETAKRHDDPFAGLPS